MKTLLEYILDEVVKEIGQDTFLEMYDKGVKEYAKTEKSKLYFGEEIVSYAHKVRTQRSYNEHN